LNFPLIFFTYTWLQSRSVVQQSRSAGQQSRSVVHRALDLGSLLQQRALRLKQFGVRVAAPSLRCTQLALRCTQLAQCIGRRTWFCGILSRLGTVQTAASLRGYPPTLNDPARQRPLR